MKVDVKEWYAKGKERWNTLPPKKKTGLLAIVGGVLFAVILATVFFGSPKDDFKAIFPGMESAEAAQVYATLQEMEVQPKIDERGQVLVPSDMWDELVFQLNSKGYPKTTLSYDTFASAAGFTATEFEKKTALIFQAQDRAQQTLMRQEGIVDAAVTFTVPDTSNYIWDQSNTETSTAGVTVTLKQGYELTPERVSTIQHLAATSVPKLKPEDVVVVDAATGLEMPSLDDADGTGFFGVARLELERAIASEIEQNVKRLLTPIYGANGVTPVATVSLDYDKMMTETKQYQPVDQGDGGGVRNHFEERYSLDGSVAVEGIVGEENNTDAPPQYPNQDGTGTAATTDYEKSIDYDISYVMTQIEKGAPLLKTATIAVIVNDSEFDTQREETLVDLISKGTNIAASNIKVTNLEFAAKPVDAQPDEVVVPPEFSLRQILLLSLGGLLLVIIIIIVIVVLVRRRKRRKQMEEEMILAEEAAQHERDLAREISEHKRMLKDEAKANTKESAITDEVRDFAQENPEITANLLRSMLREDS